MHNFKVQREARKIEINYPNKESKMELLSAFINRVALIQSTIVANQKRHEELISENPTSAFEAVFCGSNYDLYRQRQELIFIIESEFEKGQIIVNNQKKYELLVKKGNTQYEFSKYIDRNWVSLQGIDSSSIVAVLNDKTIHDQDLLFTSNGMIVLGWILDSGETSYKDIKCQYPNILIGNEKYHSKNISTNGLYALIEKLKALSEKNEEAQKGTFANEVKSMFFGQRSSQN